MKARCPKCNHELSDNEFSMLRCTNCYTQYKSADELQCYEEGSSDDIQDEGEEISDSELCIELVSSGKSFKSIMNVLCGLSLIGIIGYVILGIYNHTFSLFISPIVSLVFTAIITFSLGKLALYMSLGIARILKLQFKEKAGE